MRMFDKSVIVKKELLASDDACEAMEDTDELRTTRICEYLAADAYFPEELPLTPVSIASLHLEVGCSATVVTSCSIDSHTAK